jgi:Cupin-like domain
MLDRPSTVSANAAAAAPRATSAAVAGPDFQFVDEITWEELVARGKFAPPTRPVLIKGAVKAWPAWKRWTFEKLARLKRKDGGVVTASFQNGLVEQGVTKKPVIQPVGPYLQDLARQGEAPIPEDMGLLSSRRRKDLKKSDKFKLDWSYMKSFKADKVYLAQWNILEEFPEMKKDFAITSVWPGLRWTWEFVFMGPAHTVTGIHYDFPNNWFCQVAGTKEFLLFPPDQAEHMCESAKYDWGATLSDIDISRLDEQPLELASFEKAKGIYARVEAGDALFVPSKTWHCVVALEPSISLAVFGLTPPEIIIGGGASTLRNILHTLHLYRWGNCTCHKMDPADKMSM